MKQLTVLFNGKKQAVYLLDEPYVVVGRGRSVHIALDDNPIVSRQHCCIREEAGTHLLQDLGGANGTFVGEQRITQVRLQEGDRIVLGKHTLRYEESTGVGRSLKTGAASAAVEPAATQLVQGLAPWEGAGSVAKTGGSESTMAASREELEHLIAQMKVKSGPHLSVAHGDRMQLVPLAGKVLIGHTDACHVRLDGPRFFGRLAAQVHKEGDDWYLVGLSPLWNPVLVGANKVRQKRKLTQGTTFSVQDRKLRFSLGESG